MPWLISFMSIHCFFFKFFCCCLYHNFVSHTLSPFINLSNRHCFDQDRLHENDHINLNFLLTLLLLSFEKLKLMLLLIHIKILFNALQFTHFVKIISCVEISFASVMSARNILRVSFNICWSVSCQLYFLVRYEKFDSPKWQNIIKFADCFKLTLLLLLFLSDQILD